MTEIQQYLPDDHPDKFSNFNTPKYKMGDWVTVIPSDNSFLGYSKAVGYTFQIRKDKNYYQYFMEGHESAIDPDNKFCINYRLQDVRPATLEEITKVQLIASDKMEKTSKADLITRAVKTNNPQLIADELGCSIEEIIESCCFM